MYHDMTWVKMREKADDEELMKAVLHVNEGARRVNMDTLYARLLEVFEDGELHTYAECWEKVLKGLYPLGWNKGSFNSLYQCWYIEFVDKGGNNRSYRYKISRAGELVLKTAKINQKVFRFLRHFKDKNKDDFFAAILKKQLEDCSGEVLDDVSPAGFLRALEALCLEENYPWATQFGNYDVYKRRIFNLIEKTSALDEILNDPVVLDTCYKKIAESNSQRERYRWFEMYDYLRFHIDRKEKVRKSHVTEHIDQQKSELAAQSSI